MVVVSLQVLEEEHEEAEDKVEMGYKGGMQVGLLRQYCRRMFDKHLNNNFCSHPLLAPPFRFLFPFLDYHCLLDQQFLPESMGDCIA